MTDARSLVLIVDDEPANIRVLADLLKPDHDIVVALNGEQALARAVMAPAPDLILLDVMMPRMTGHEVCTRLKADAATRDIPVIFVTAMSAEEDEGAGLALGAVDYIIKPVVPSLVQARVRTHLALSQARRELAGQNQRLDQLVKERTQDLEITQDVTIFALATLAETRDNETGNHIRRTQRYMGVLAGELSRHPDFAAELDPASIDLMVKSAPLHDIGKVGIPDEVLKKPGKLTPAEYEIMKQHPAFGRDAILASETLLGDRPNSFLRFAREIAYTHHERWDGTGYPQGLAGDAIPLSGRLMAVADVYDALITRRVYKPPFTSAEAAGIIREGEGLHFDPRIVQAFLRVEPAFLAIAGQYEDPGPTV